VVIFEHDEYRRLGKTEAERQAAYRELFRYHLDPGVIDAIRDATNRELVVGASRFKDEVEAMTKRRARIGQPGCPRNAVEGEY
jgi:putative transposase